MKSLLVIALTLAVSAPMTAADAKGTPEDEAAIRSLLEAYQTAFDHRDLKAVLMLHTESAELVQRSGIYLKGRVELEEQYSRIFKGIFADRPPAPGPRIVSIRFLRPDVALVHGIGDASLPGVAGPTYVVTYVVTKEDGKWLIAAQNNNPVPSPAPKPNPKP